jgi:hypothetical protein
MTSDSKFREFLISNSAGLNETDTLLHKKDEILPIIRARKIAEIH